MLFLLHNAICTAAMLRIVSLLPSATELVCALGFRAGLVGRSHECDFPAGVEALPVCTAPKVRPEGASGAIHAEVTELLRRAVSMYELDLPRLEALAPQVLVTQTQCEVCAVSLADVQRALEHGIASRPRLVSLAAMDLAGVWQDVRNVAQALGVPARGEALAQALQERMEHLAGRAAAAQPKPSVACVEWLDPPMAAGNWMPELVQLAGGRNLFGTAGQHAPWLDWDELLRADPEVLVLLPCGFSLQRTLAEAPVLARQPGWSGLSAVRHGRVFAVDGQQYFNRPGPRLVESLAILIEVLHPGLRPPSLRGVAWQPLAI